MSSRYEPTERNKDRAWKWLHDKKLYVKADMQEQIVLVDSLAELLDIVEGIETENE